MMKTADRSAPIHIVCVVYEERRRVAAFRHDWVALSTSAPCTD